MGVLSIKKDLESILHNLEIDAIEAENRLRPIADKFIEDFISYFKTIKILGPADDEGRILGVERYSHKFEIYPTTGATHCLVHIKNLHELPESFKESELIQSKPSEARAKELKEVQDDIYSIIHYMVYGPVTGSFDLRKVYCEGVTEEHLKGFSTVFKEMKKLRILENYAKLNNLKFPDLENETIEYRKSLEEEHGLIGKLICNGMVSVEAAETKYTHEKAEATIKEILARKGSPNYREREIISDDREDTLLRLVQKELIAVTVYGGNHSWEDNVQKWNLLHPTDRFCLIEIIPHAYKKYS